MFFPPLFLSLVPWVAALPLIEQPLIFRKSRRCPHDLVRGTFVVG